MNILIENAESRGYLASNGEWTKHAADGRDFGGTQAAFEAAISAPIGRFNIVCYILQKPRFIIIRMDQGTGMGANPCQIQGSPLGRAQPGRDGDGISPGLLSRVHAVEMNPHPDPLPFKREREALGGTVYGSPNK